jgi:cellulose synthase/poly-beta-1,6-N-acetylglucosamine synthase-like glycosyltransferase
VDIWGGSTMVKVKQILKPNKFKIILFLMLLIPFTTLSMTIIGMFNVNPKTFPFYITTLILNDPIIFLISVVLGAMVSYILGCVLDHYIKNQGLKILIATISGIIALIIIYSLYKLVAEPLICDPVHLPQNNTVSDPVHQHGQENIYSLDILKDIKVDHQSVQDSYQHCINNLQYK